MSLLTVAIVNIYIYIYIYLKVGIVKNDLHSGRGMVRYHFFCGFYTPFIRRSFGKYSYAYSYTQISSALEPFSRPSKLLTLALAVDGVSCIWGLI
jgi:hypothetical protein